MVYTHTINSPKAGHNGCCMLSDFRRKHQISILERFLLKTSFHCLLSFTVFTFLVDWPLSPIASSVSSCQSCLLVLDLNIQWRWSYYVFILTGLLSCDSCHICKKYSHVFANPYPLDDDLEHPWTMSFLYSLKYFFPIEYSSLPSKSM